jgi:hypothetical protein
LIDLQRSEEEILAGFSPDTRRLIRRAEMEGVLYEESKNVEDFVRFFNTFARQKKLSLWLNAERLRQSGGYLQDYAGAQGRRSAVCTSVLMQ